MSEEKTIEELKQCPSYRYTKELVDAFDAAGRKGEPVEIAMKGVLDAPCPDYMPITSAVKAKILFILALYTNAGRLGSLTDGIRGMSNMISCLAEELEK